VNRWVIKGSLISRTSIDTSFPVIGRSSKQAQTANGYCSSVGANNVGFSDNSVTIDSRVAANAYGTPDIMRIILPVKTVPGLQLSEP
jgi:hypothetical protein